MISEKQLLAMAKPYRAICGIYFLIKEGEIVYVGQSTSIESRVYAHKLSKDFDSYTFVECEAQELDDVEARYIIILKPVLNRTFPRARQYICTSELKQELHLTIKKINRLAHSAGVIPIFRTEGATVYQRKEVLAAFENMGYQLGGLGRPRHRALRLEELHSLNASAAQL